MSGPDPPGGQRPEYRVLARRQCFGKPLDGSIFGEIPPGGPTPGRVGGRTPTPAGHHATPWQRYCCRALGRTSRCGTARGCPPGTWRPPSKSAACCTTRRASEPALPSCNASLAGTQAHNHSALSEVNKYHSYQLIAVWMCFVSIRKQANQALSGFHQCVFPPF